MMTPDTLREIGLALHGHMYRAALSREIDVNERTMNRWLAGHNPIPAGLGDTILPMLEKRYADIERLIARLKGD